MNAELATIPNRVNLYINHYKCRCENEYTVPNPRLLYEYKHKRYHKTIVVKAGHSFVGLKREIRHAPALSLESCPTCFRTGYDTTQHTFDFLPDPPPEIVLDSNGHPVVPTPLDEF